MTSCLFCRVVAGEIPADVVYQSDTVTAFNDINPQAPVHVLVVPNTHMPNFSALAESGDTSLHVEVAKVARQVTGDGDYRLIANCGDEAGQSVDHLHFHILSGRQLSWPPG